MKTYKEENLEYKYRELPEDAPRHRKKSRKKRPKKADHKHHYENCVIKYRRKSDRYLRGEKVSDSGDEGIVVTSYCPICGKVGLDPVDDEFRKRFPRLFLPYIPFDSIPEDAKNWILERYPVFYLEDYDEYRLSGQVFIDLSEIKSSENT